VWTDDRFDGGRTVGECSSFVIFPGISCVLVVIVSWIAFKCAERERERTIVLAYESRSGEVSSKRCSALARRILWTLLLLCTALQPLILFAFENDSTPSSLVLGALITFALAAIVGLVHEEFEASYRGLPFPAAGAYLAIFLWTTLAALFGLQLWPWIVRFKHAESSAVVLGWDKDTVDLTFYTSAIKFALAASCAIVGVVDTILRQSSSSRKNDDAYVDLEHSAAVASLHQDRSDGDVATVSASPELRSGWISRLSFSWMNQLMKVGASRTLEDDDLYRLCAEDRAETVLDALRRMWSDEEQHPETASLSRALRKALGFKFMLAGLLKFVYDTQQFVGPQLLKQLVNYLNEDTPKSDKGWWFVGALCLNALVQTAILHQYFHLCFRTGMRAKSAVTAIVFQKALVLDPTLANDAVASDESHDNAASETVGSSKSLRAPLLKESAAKEGNLKSKKKSTDEKSSLNSRGSILTLMSVDAQRLQDLCPYLHMIWSGPYQITLALYFMYREIGAFTAVGVGVMAAMIPLTAIVAAKVRTLQKKLMVQKDSRMKVTGEALGGMRILKLNAWGAAFAERIMKIRNFELKLLWQYTIMSLLASLAWTGAPVLVSCGTFAAFSLIGNEELTASRAFTALALINLLQFPLFMLPRTISNVMEATVTVDRLKRFLLKKSIAPRKYLPPPPVSKDEGKDQHGRSRHRHWALSVDKSDFYWDSKRRFPLLHDLDFRVDSGELVMVIGSTGSGKSGLCKAIIGDLMNSDGQRIQARGHLAYASQVPFIQNMTLRDNVLFGAPFEKSWYERCLKVCALEPDLKVLPGGDLTEIGAKGINLSGGQRARVGLCRCIYQRSDVYVLDDCLSAVDNHVAKHIFEQCIMNVLRASGRTVILVTNNISFLNRADRVMYLDGASKRVSFFGKYEDILGAGIDLVDMETSRKDGVADDDAAESGGAASKSDNSEVAVVRRRTSTGGESAQSNLAREETKTSQSGDKDDADAGGSLIKEESVFSGAVGLSVYKTYAAAGGGLPIVVAVLVGIVLTQGLSVGSGRWLAAWSENEGERSTATYVGVYAGLSFGGLLMTLVAQVVFAIGSVRASKLLHDRLLGSMMTAPMSFFDTTPLGRIQNRFSKDMYAIDEALAYALRTYLRTASAAIATIVVISVVTPLFLAGMVPVMLIYWYAQNYYIPTSRQLKRINSKLRSPIFDHFEETLEGASSIRAFGHQQRFVRTNLARVDRCIQGYYLSIASNRWLATRLECVGTGIVTLAAAFAVFGKGPNNFAGLGGLSITYALSVTQTLNWMVRMTSEREQNIVSVERVSEYAEIPPEDIWKTVMPPKSWPTSGRIRIQNLRVRYRPGLPLVLGRFSCPSCEAVSKFNDRACRNCGFVDKSIVNGSVPKSMVWVDATPSTVDSKSWKFVGVDADIRPGEKIGVVGRTGSGKSSLLYSFMRLVEPSGGRIEVDGVDISTLAVSDLRSRISIIPQEPWLCAGSVRFNVDPPGFFSDTDIWKALEKAHFAAHVRSLPGTLDYMIEEGGHNLSVGQAQLVCLARSLLRRSPILLLDEATAAVDNQTDALIQDTIRREFKSCTIITIAHRIDTITDSDRILVLDDGLVVEFDSPAALLCKKSGGYFKAMYDARPKMQKASK